MVTDMRSYRLRSHTRQQQAAGAAPGAVGQQRMTRGTRDGDLW